MTKRVLRSAVPALLASAVLLAGCGGSTKSTAPGSTSVPLSAAGGTSLPSTSVSQPVTTASPPATTASGGALAPPAVPPSGAYLGAWINPQHLQAPAATAGAAGSSVASAELQQLGTVQTALSRPLGILHAYTAWDTPAPVSSLTKIAATGAVPMLDWACGVQADITSGTDDTLITAYATALKGYGKPVFLRYAWEMNLKPALRGRCEAGAPPSGFVAAWQHIYQTFHQVGATNVSFVWCPGVSGGNFSAFYPGASSVDWICADGYDRKHTGATAFAKVFGPWYNQLSGQGKPMMIGETGAMAVDQASYIQSLGSVLPQQFPGIKALVYFDAPGPAGNWALQPDGLAAFAALARSSYFSFRA